ncbi:DUF2637 domain-containing protein [Streptomyces sp. TRM43335]|uniref:DUF2637 domain-containing protein n=1 Tax=Streptomyces taklimakanensis TaxID=2569853 RepID=A0A6G2BK00_9ACTN|nr:DUF2637 domain-containing protein [Streptomyces taklimakanensis]MTE22611.1 DUF2637 domain-containing protein [Streptomyces taklimakanensis]
MTTIAPPPTTARPPAASTPPAAASSAPAPTSSTPGPTSSTPAAASSTPRDRAAVLGRLLLCVAVLGGAVVAGIGFAGSYSALRQLAAQKGFGDFAPWFPIGVDAGIIVALAADLYLLRRGVSWPWLRPVAHGLTLATVWFNANAGELSPAADPVAAAMHAVMPLLFVVAVEAARFLVVRTADLEAGRETGGVPLLRWLLSPARTWTMWRRMKLWGLPYSAVVARERALRVYRVMLERQYGKAKHAPSDARLPLTMARYGLTVDEALALPQAAEEQERERREAEADRKVAEEIRAKEREAERRKAALRADGSVKTTAAEVGAQTAAAERLAALEAEAVDSAAVAEARAREAAAEARQAEERARRQEADRKAAEEELRAAELRRQAAEEDQAAELEARAVETERAAEARLRAAEANRRAAEIEARAAEDAARAAEARRQKQAADRAVAEDEAAAAEARQRAVEATARALEIERRAVETEDELRLSPTERAARKVARLVLAEAGGDAERLPLERVAEALGGVSPATASARRKEAAALLADGYRP